MNSTGSSGCVIARWLTNVSTHVPFAGRLSSPREGTRLYDNAHSDRPTAVLG
jgi:hypothetical protein